MVIPAAFDAVALAKQVGVVSQAPGKFWKGCDYFADATRFVVVAGAQLGSQADLALARGLTYCHGLDLVLVLPVEHAFATLQRAPWLAVEAQPEIWLHDGTAATPCPLPSPGDTIKELSLRLKAGVTLAADLQAAATPTHLGVNSPAVYDLVEWATTHDLLDGSHRQGTRAWQCMGQRVLSITGSSLGLKIVAGIHYGHVAAAPLVLTKADTLTVHQLDHIKDQVQAGIQERLTGPSVVHKPDEHWLQAVIRRDPSLVGVEQPALRELPAWRPCGAPQTGAKKWGRGFIDLVGVDGHGDVRVVETKIADNQDDLLIFQGLDYYVWATASQRVLVERLGAPAKAELEIHYVVGDNVLGDIHISTFAAAQAAALDKSIRWRFQTIHEWYHGPTDHSHPTSHLLAPYELP